MVGNMRMTQRSNKFRSLIGILALCAIGLFVASAFVLQRHPFGGQSGPLSNPQLGICFDPESESVFGATPGKLFEITRNGNFESVLEVNAPWEGDPIHLRKLPHKTGAFLLTLDLSKFIRRCTFVIELDKSLHRVQSMEKVSFDTWDAASYLDRIWIARFLSHEEEIKANPALYGSLFCLEAYANIDSSDTNATPVPQRSQPYSMERWSCTFATSDSTPVLFHNDPERRGMLFGEFENTEGLPVREFGFHIPTKQSSDPDGILFDGTIAVDYSPDRKHIASASRNVSSKSVLFLAWDMQRRDLEVEIEVPFTSRSLDHFARIEKVDCRWVNADCCAFSVGSEIYLVQVATKTQRQANVSSHPGEQYIKLLRATETPKGAEINYICLPPMGELIGKVVLEL